MRFHLTFSAFIALAIGVSACGKKDEAKKGTSAKANLALANATTAGSGLSGACQVTPGNGNVPEFCWTPSVFALKMLAVRISADRDGSANGPSGLIWSNTACPTRTSKVNVGTGDAMKTYDYDVQDACNDGMVTDYFNFARPTETVNADLNSQDRTIPPGTYSYVQMDFCIGTPQSNNLSFQADGMTEPLQLTNAKCGVVSEPTAAPVVVAEGEAVTISLAYDLSDIIYQNGPYKDAKYCYVSADQATVRCVSDFRSLKPSFVKR